MNWTSLLATAGTLLALGVGALVAYTRAETKTQIAELKNYVLDNFVKAADLRDVVERLESLIRRLEARLDR